MKTPSLVILAAGMGSRYGGIKQLDGFGPNGESIIDYTIYDALKVGFGKIIFVIREQIDKEFRETILEPWKDKGDFRVVYQELDALPDGYSVPEGRTKPWGTAHAVWMAECEVNEPFAIVNADDFYGRDSLKAIFDHLSGMDDDSAAGCMVGYELRNTLTENGTVSRGVCVSDSNGHLTGITERTKIYRNGSSEIVFEEAGEKTHLPEKTLVSMNLMGFSSKVFEEINAGFADLYKRTTENVNVEYYIPTILNNYVTHGVKVPVIPTSDAWFGVTYSEDKEWVSEQIIKLVEGGTYPADLME
ncbi:MAG: NTP transferase domain-containing protein [Cyclobacteriaceae bacterium]